jgi:tRNA1Val (adenine37-N6)-methyltransferase
VAEDWTIDGLTSGWKIAQRKRGHRHSTDDLLTGWYAAECAPEVTRILDLGAGIGSVGLLALWRLPGASLTAVEAQDMSFTLLEHNIAMNHLASRVRAIHGDLRTVRFPGESFGLVTGSPPYFDVRAGVVPADPQKAHARFELRGDVRDYCSAAREALGPNGRFVFCFPAPQRARAEAAIAEAGLTLVRSREVIPREGAGALFSLFCCAAGAVPRLVEPAYVVRDAEGAQTAEHAATRATFGMPALRGA